MRALVGEEARAKSSWTFHSFSFPLNWGMGFVICLIIIKTLPLHYVIC